jgi:hypothetical protein
LLLNVPYDRARAVEYAKRWALSRNPLFIDFTGQGGDCTNFASQCLFAGCGVMNFTPVFGWFYKSLNERAPAWTGVEYFYRFLTENAVGDGVGSGAGPFAVETDVAGLRIGDFVQFGRTTEDFYHTPVVVGFANGEPLLAAHSYDAFGRKLSSYTFDKLRCLRVLGARV